jgi:Cupin domain
MSRRVVTGFDAKGRSVFVSDGPTTRGAALDGVPNFRIDEVWSTRRVPELPAPSGDPVLAEHQFFPVPGGTGFVIVTFPPDAEVERAAAAGLDLAAAQSRFYGAFPGLEGTMEPDAPGMHASQTVDYGVVLSGEVWLELDDGAEVHLKAGNCVVQNGTRHAWHNKSGKTSMMAFVVVGATREK